MSTEKLLPAVQVEDPSAEDVWLEPQSGLDSTVNPTECREHPDVQLIQLYCPLQFWLSMIIKQDNQDKMISLLHSALID